jgi:hypothetical protein
MTEPKYQIGDRVHQANKFIVQGIAPLANGDYRYFIQVADSDNTFIASSEDLNIVTLRMLSESHDRDWYDIPSF